MHKFVLSFFIFVVMCGFTMQIEAQIPPKETQIEKTIPLPPELREPETPASDSRFMSEFFNMLLVLGMIVVLLYVGSWMFRRMLTQRNMQMNETSEIKVLEQRSLSPKSALYLVSVFGKTLLISESQNGVKFLADLPEKQELNE